MKPYGREGRGEGWVLSGPDCRATARLMISAARASAVLFLVKSCAGAIDSSERQRFHELTQWVAEIGGVANGALVIGETSGGLRGLFLDKAVAKDEALVGIPLDYVIGHDSQDNKCKMIKAFEKEVRLGDSSRLHPYIKMDDSLNSPIPGLWSDEAIRMLQDLTPKNPAVHFRWYLRNCLGRELPSLFAYAKAFSELPIEERRAVLAFVTRIFNIGFLPVVDLANHDNSNTNTYMARDETGNMMLMKASRDLEPGEQVIRSYGHTSTPQIFYCE